MRRSKLQNAFVFALMLGGGACDEPEDATGPAEAEVESSVPDTSSLQRAAAGAAQTLVVNPASDPVKTTVLGPVTVQGSTSVSGSVTCNQAAPYQVTGSVDIGSPTVNAVLAGEPTVNLAPALTERAYLNTVTIPADGAISAFIDTSGYEEVRVVFMSNCASCSVKIRFYIENMLIDETTVSGADVHTQNFRVPGTQLMINMEDPGATPANVKLAVFGRP